MFNLISFHAIDNSNRHEARKAILDDLANSKPFSIPAGAPTPASSPPSAKAPSPVSTPSKVQNETYSNSQDYRANSAFMQVDSQRIDKEEEKTENFLQKYVKEEEEEEDKKDEGLVDYLLQALKGEEKEARMEGNSYMSDGVKAEYYQRNFPGLFGSTQGM